MLFLTKKQIYITKYLNLNNITAYNIKLFELYFITCVTTLHF